jgi:molybdopterin-guanine dinucleotide biosynthesis protein A
MRQVGAIGVGGAARFDAVVLAGGTGRRMGGVDKAGLVVAGVPLLDRVLSAAAAARHTVVVGEPRPTVREVHWAREDPPGGGPLAGLAAGMATLSELTDLPESTAGQPGPAEAAEDLPVVVLATDLPWLRPSDLDRLTAALAADPTADAVVFSDPDGHAQPLAGAYRIRPIRVALAAVEPVDGKPVKLVLHALAVVTVPDQGAAGDCDTPDQLAAARAHFDRQG